MVVKCAIHLFQFVLKGLKKFSIDLILDGTGF